MRSQGSTWRICGRLVLLAFAWGLAGCHARAVTAERIQGAIAPTFANLVHLQLVHMGMPAVAASDLRVLATCHKLDARTGATGAGDWVCTLAWSCPGVRSSLRDVYEVSVRTDGCFTATADGAESKVGGPMVTKRDGTEVTNLLYVFEGCFDTS